MEQFTGRVFGGPHHGERHLDTRQEHLSLISINNPTDLSANIIVALYRRCTLASQEDRAVVWIPEGVPRGREMEYILLVALEAGNFGAEYDRRVGEGEFDDGPDNNPEQRPSEASANLDGPL